MSAPKEWVASLFRHDGTSRVVYIAAPTDFFMEPMSAEDLRPRKFARTVVDVDAKRVAYEEVTDSTARFTE